MRHRTSLIRFLSLALPALLIVGACVLYARSVSTRFPNGDPRELPRPPVRPPASSSLRLEPVGLTRLPGAPLKLSLHDDRLYASLASDGLAIYDLADPLKPVLRNHIVAADDDGRPLPEYVLNAVSVGSSLIVLDRLRGLVVYDASDPFRPRFQLEKRLPGSPGHQATNLQEIDNLIFLASGGAGLRVLPREFLSDSYAPALLERFDHTTDLAILPPHWLVLTDGRHTGVQILDISDVIRPRILGTHSLSSYYLDSIAIVGRHAYLTTRGTNVVMALNLDDPSRPYLASFFRGPARSSVKSIGVWNERFLFLGNFYHFIEVLDVSDPENPVLDSVVPSPGRVNTLAIRDDLLYAGLWPDRRLAIYRIVDRNGTPPAMANENHPRPSPRRQ